MLDLRALLLACRPLARGDHADLLPRIEQALTALSDAQPPASPAMRVALAWQAAARQLKPGHPEIYASLQERAMRILDARLPEEPVDELLRLEREVAALAQSQAKARAEREQIEAAAQAARDQRDALYLVLEAAAPDIVADDPHSQALLRVASLHAAARAPAAAAAAATTARTASNGPIPDAQLLRDVVAGEGRLNDAQRDWLVDQALGLTGWTLSPLELIEKGDAWLAALLLEKGDVPA